MNNTTENTGTSDWNEGDPTEGRTSLRVGSRLGPFLVGDLLGHGGMGLVYEATHSITGAELALKTLRRVDSSATRRLKDEFRLLAEVKHRNLVQLFELHTIDDVSFLTMERIVGTPLKAYLERPDLTESARYSSVRDVFAQIAEGLGVLHEEQLLHLDLKPDNVMVDREGCVRILDFGITKPLGQLRPSTSAAVAGTPRYMAPERLRKGEESPATDCYSLGVMLAEVLAPNRQGELGTGSFSPQIPKDLVELCGHLLADEPTQRPKAREVVERLGGEISGTFRASGSRNRIPIAEGSLVGREGELRALSRSLSQARRGALTWVHITGESGVGKTALIEAFRHFASRKDDVIVLKGTCHERESMPFQGLDGVLDDLASQFIERREPLDEKHLQWFAAAEAIAPSFGDSRGPAKLTVDTTPLERRRGAFLAVKMLIEDLCRTHTVVIVLDDVQWGDSDGARLLAELLARPSVTRCLVVTVGRPPVSSEEDLEFLEKVGSVVFARGSAVKRESIDLHRLTDADVRRLVDKSGSELPVQSREAIVRASRGLPILAEALGGHPWSTEEDPSLDALLRARLADVPPGGLLVLQALALSPSPIPQNVALQTIHSASERGEALAALRNARLVRTIGPTPDGPLEPYHGLIAEAVRAPLSTKRRRRLRAQLATMLEASSEASPEQLASLYHLAGKTAQAAHWAPRAALDAETALAFESAAHWYGRAAAWDQSAPLEFLVERARCLEYAGRNAEAARTYEDCAKLEATNPSRYIRQAGAAWLSAGYVDHGLAALEPELRALGYSVPSSERAALVNSMYLLWKLRRRRIEEYPKALIYDGPKLDGLDTLWNTAKALGMVLVMRGFSLQLQCLLAALEVGEAKRIARSLAVVGIMLSGSPLEELGRQWMDIARKISLELKDNYLQGLIPTFEAVQMSADWEPPARILERAERALTLLRQAPGANSWEQAMALTSTLRAREHLGRFPELERISNEWLATSTDRGDRFAQSMAHQANAMVCLAQNRPDEARRHASASIEKWSRDSFTVQHYYALRYQVQSDLADGDGASAKALLDGSWKQLAQAQMLRNPISRPELLQIRGLTELAAANARGTKRCRSAEKVAQTLRNEQSTLARAHGELILAGCGWLSKKSSAGLKGARIALQEYRVRGLLLQAACLELAIARASNDPAGTRGARENLRMMGVVDCDRYSRIHVPEFPPSAHGR